MKRIYSALITLFGLAFVSCSNLLPESGNSKGYQPVHNDYETKNDHNDVRVVAVLDRSLSYINSYDSNPQMNLFIPILRTCAGKKLPMNIRVGIIGDTTNVFYSFNFVPAPQNINGKVLAANPWEPNQSSSKDTFLSDDAPSLYSQWKQYESSVDAKLSLPASRKSDCHTAVNMAITSIQEEPRSSKRFLVFCTDFIDNRNRVSVAYLPEIDSTVTIIIVGVVTKPDPIMFRHHNVLHFSLLSAAIKFISSSI